MIRGNDGFMPGSRRAGASRAGSGAWRQACNARAERAYIMKGHRS
jgi:hypothetical protein